MKHPQTDPQTEQRGRAAAPPSPSPNDAEPGQQPEPAGDPSELGCGDHTPHEDRQPADASRDLAELEQLVDAEVNAEVNADSQDPGGEDAGDEPAAEDLQAVAAEADDAWLEALAYSLADDPDDQVDDDRAVAEWLDELGIDLEETDFDGGSD
ncbi:MAG: hypothetical protein AAGB00_13530 [Planctomycetota bacterium]